MDFARDGFIQVSQLQHRYHLINPDVPLFRSYAQALREVDMMRVDGSFVDAEGNKVGLSLTSRVIEL